VPEIVTESPTFIVLGLTVIGKARAGNPIDQKIVEIRTRETIIFLAIKIKNPPLSGSGFLQVKNIIYSH